jgi:hypothetical protein
VFAILLSLVQVLSADTVAVSRLEQSPSPSITIDSARLGSPQVKISTRQRPALVWLLRAGDTVFIAASISDTSQYWGDDFVISLDTRGEGAADPQHEDFQWYFRRTIDSSIVYRGRNGHWQPPRDDPDWRLGADRSGGGWEVTTRNRSDGWSLLLRLAPEWFAGENGARPRIAFGSMTTRPMDGSPGRHQRVPSRQRWWSGHRLAGYQSSGRSLTAFGLRRSLPSFGMTRAVF